MNREIAFSNGTRVVIGPSWAVTTLPSGRELHAHPDGSEAQAGTARKLGYGDDVAALTREHDLIHSALCDWLGLPASYALSEAAGEPSDPTLAELEERAVMAVQAFIRRSGGRLPF